MIILDTDVLSDLMKPEPNPNVVAWLRATDPGDIATTAITIAEIRFGLERMPKGKRRNQAKADFENLIDDTYLRNAIYAFDAPAAYRYAVIAADLERIGRLPGGADGDNPGDSFSEPLTDQRLQPLILSAPCGAEPSSRSIACCALTTGNDQVAARVSSGSALPGESRANPRQPASSPCRRARPRPRRASAYRRRSWPSSSRGASARGLAVKDSPLAPDTRTNS